ncbi:MAG: cation:dicarboxylase symporter family transporter, partial [Candidatus Margulisiibacteriota bacterium]|nr:cation:dicarboxylase symporter family transporter [Candidatus Margulisiibacteriota bacterium]
MKNLQINIILAVILGVLAGFYAGDFLYVYEFLGNAFINVLKYVVVPLVFASLVSGIISLGNITLLQKMGLKTLVYFVATTFVASSIGIALAKLLNPGSGFSVISDGAAAVSKAMTFKEMFFEIIPQDFM